MTDHHHPDKKLDFKADINQEIENLLEIKRAEEDEEITTSTGAKIKIKKGEIKKQGKKILDLHPNDKHKLELYNKTLSKLCFDTIIRFFYVAKKDKMTLHGGIMPVVNTLTKTFNKPGFGEFEFKTLTYQSDYNFSTLTAWQIPCSFLSRVPSHASLGNVGSVQ